MRYTDNQPIKNRFASAPLQLSRFQSRPLRRHHGLPIGRVLIAVSRRSIRDTCCTPQASSESSRSRCAFPHLNEIDEISTGRRIGSAHGKIVNNVSKPEDLHAVRGDPSNFLL